jgi:hypothetical protein
MPGVPPVGPKGPNFDPTGTVPVAGSPADPGHPAQVPGAPPQRPQTPEDAAQREYEADRATADIAQKQVGNAEEAAKVDETERAKRAELRKAQLAEQEKEDARQAAGIAKATADRDRLQSAVQDFKFHNFWDNVSTPRKILAGIGILLGSASYSENHVNEANRTIDNAVAQEWDQQKAELEKRRDDAKNAGANLAELDRQYKEDSGKLALRQELQLKALADEMDALASHSKNQAGILGLQKTAADARALAEQHGAAGVKAIAQAHSEALKDEEVKAQTAEALAKAGKLNRRASAGGGGSALDDKYVQLTHAIAAGKDGKPLTHDQIVIEGHRLGLPQVAKAGRVSVEKAEKESAFGAKAEAAASAAAAKAEDLPKDTVIIDNKPIGLAPSGKGGAAQFENRYIQYNDAVRSLKELLASMKGSPIGGMFPTGDLYNHAVLAIAATTTANPSDSTTHKEENTLRGSLKEVSRDAVQRSLDHVLQRQKEFNGTLRPIPERYLKPKAPAGNSKLNAAQQANLPAGFSVAD